MTNITLKFEEMNRAERDEVVALFANWLKQYTHEVIVKVMERREEIIANEFAMHLLRELKTREEKEAERFADNIGWLFRNYDDFKNHDVHNDVLTHAGSYRDVLYDMYIKG